MIGALVLLLFVFAVIIVMLVAFVFPPHKWLEWLHTSAPQPKAANDATLTRTATGEPRPSGRGFPERTDDEKSKDNL